MCGRRFGRAYNSATPGTTRRLQAGMSRREDTSLRKLVGTVALAALLSWSVGLLFGRPVGGSSAPPDPPVIAEQPSPSGTIPEPETGSWAAVAVPPAVAETEPYDGGSARAADLAPDAEASSADQRSLADDAESSDTPLSMGEAVRSEAADAAGSPEPPILSVGARISEPDPMAAACDKPPPPPLPPPGSSPEAWQAFRTPLPPAPVWDPPGRKRVGLQAGHWRLEEVPRELGRLEHGASGGGKAEWEVNLDLARRAAELLRAAGVDVDILPAAVPVGYRAHAFVSIHADGDQTGSPRGYKLARSTISATPEADDGLVRAVYAEYGEATGLPRDDDRISRRMTGYYAFNSRRYCHAVAPGVPAVILETGYLTSATDRQLLLGRPDAAARGIARGLLRYLNLPA